MKAYENISNPTARFAIALSFPGEVRARAKAIALRLADELARDRVFYDGFHEAEVARLNLDVHLQTIYREDSELIVVFLCKDYEKKEWCGLEWRAIRDIIKQRRGDIMLLRLDDTPIPGVLSIDGYLDIRNRTDEETAALILERWRQEHMPAAHERTPTPTGFKDAGTIRHGRSVICNVGLQRGERVHVAFTAEHDLDLVICTPEVFKKWRSDARLTGSLHHARRTKDMAVTLVAKETSRHYVLLINNTRRKTPITYTLEITEKHP